MTNRSESLNEIFAALAKAQSEMGIAGHNTANPHFKSKFADLTELVRVSRPSLSKNGLSVIHQVLPDSQGDHYMHALLCHASGQFIETRIRLSPDKSDIQSLGKYITYLKRYTYAAIVGVVTSDEDDDGESLMQDSRKPISQAQAFARSFVETITKDQLEQLEYELKGHADIEKTVLSGMKRLSLKELPKEDYTAIFKRVRELIAVKENR